MINKISPHEALSLKRAVHPLQSLDQLQLFKTVYNIKLIQTNVAVVNKKTPCTITITFYTSLSN